MKIVNKPFFQHIVPNQLTLFDLSMDASDIGYLFTVGEIRSMIVPAVSDS